MSKQKKTVAIYLDSPGTYDYPFSEQRYINSYSDLCFTLNELGVEARIARGSSSYDGKGVFLSSYIFDADRNLVDAGKVHADLIFDKGDRTTLPYDGFPKVNSLQIDELCNSKEKTALVYADVSPRTEVYNNTTGLTAALQVWPKDQLVVVKPSDGFGGEGIQIALPKDIVIKEVGYPVLLQEFMDTSGGVPGVVEGVHDMRVLVLNGELVQFSVRQPVEGSLLSNIKQGGSIQQLSVHDIPGELNMLVEHVDEYMAQYGPRFFSVDAAYDGRRFRLIELNSRPGWHPRNTSTEASSLVDSLAQMLADSTA